MLAQKKRILPIVFVLTLIPFLVFFLLLSHSRVASDDWPLLDPLPLSLREQLQDRWAGSSIHADSLLEGFLDLLHVYDRSDSCELLDLVVFDGDPRRTTLEEALEDVEVLFALFRHMYTGYEVFGGDDVFDQAKSTLIAALEAETRSLTAWRFRSVIMEHLSFVQDYHFSLEGMYNVIPRASYLTHDTSVIHEEDDCFVLHATTEEGTTRLGQIVSVNGESAAAYLTPSLDPDGRFIYRFGVVSEQREVVLSVLLLSDAGEQALSVSLTMGDRGYRGVPDAGRIYRRHEVQEVPVIVCRALHSRDGVEERQLQQFLDDAPLLREEPFVILDLRGNRGGTLLPAVAWLTGYVHDYRVNGSSRRRQLEDDLYKQKMKAYLYSPAARNLTRRAAAVSGVSHPSFVGARTLLERPGWLVFEYEPMGRMVNQTPLLVIVDGGTASAGEWFVSLLRQMENVLVVGYPTAGILTFVGPEHYTLPHSRLTVALPSSFNLGADLEVRESRGFEPDLWVEPSRAVEAAAQYLRRHLSSQAEDL